MKSTIRFALGKTFQGYSNVFSYSGGTTLFYVYEKDDKSEIAFGFGPTKGKIFPPSKDWLEDLEIDFKTWVVIGESEKETFNVHDGFMDEYKKVRNLMFNYLGKGKYARVTLSGFSQGAAIASLAIVELAMLRPELAIVADAYGCPRSYAIESAERVSNMLAGSARYRFTRINHYGDPVSAVPPASMMYKHIGLEILFGNRKWYDTFIRCRVHVHNGEDYMKELEQE
jgi:hypothetical protein